MWYAGRGRNGAKDTYWVKRNGIQSWINRHGYLSIPAHEVKRIRHRNVGFFDLGTFEKWVTSSKNFKNAEVTGVDVTVEIEKFDYFYRTEEE
jgi:hypothetical protein